MLDLLFTFAFLLKIYFKCSLSQSKSSKVDQRKKYIFNAHLTLSERKGGKVSQGQCMYGIGYTLGIFSCRHRSKDAEVEVIG